MDKDHIAYKIWSEPEVVIFIFLGSAADFALNKNADWLFYTNELPSNPLERFLDTIFFSRKQVFLDERQKIALADRIRKIHTGVENRRSKDEGHSTHIPNRAFVEVGDMIVDYGIRGYEYVNKKKMTNKEKNDFFLAQKAFYEGMHVEYPDKSYDEFEVRRSKSIKEDYTETEWTYKLYDSYLRDFSAIVDWVFLKLQAEFVREDVKDMLKEKVNLKRNYLFTVVYKIYPYIRSKFLTKMVIRGLFRREIAVKLLTLVD